MKCPYCKQEAEWVENKEVYGVNYGRSYMIWLCRDCDAYVGCHKNTKKAYGSLANKHLRHLRVEAKNLFIQKFLGGDWHCPKHVKEKAYAHIKGYLGRSKNRTHFGKFREETCIKLIDYFNSIEHKLGVIQTKNKKKNEKTMLTKKTKFAKLIP